VLVAATLAGCSERTEPVAEDQAVRPARVVVATATLATIEHQFVARVEAAQTIDVSFEVAGPLARLPIREGQTVARGELVAALDPTHFELAVREAEVELQLARQDLERKQQVLNQQGIARSLVDDARSQYELQQVRLAQTRERLADSWIVAPFDAYIAQRHVDNHVNIQAGQPVARLTDLHELLIVTNIPERLLATVGTEQVLAVTVEFRFAPGERLPLTYRENRGEADAVAQTYEVSFTLERPERWNVLPGMTATVHVSLRAPDGDIAIAYVPTSALVSGPDNDTFVWLFDPETELVEQRAVRIGTPAAQGVPVLAGLEGGELVIATGASQLRSGMRVRRLEAARPD
jgi:RND family efflux transporter MFP subunit